jgi:hypothetical protein
MKRQHIMRFSLALTVILMMCLTVGSSTAQARNLTSASLNEALVSTQKIELNIGVCAPSAGPFSTELTNPYFPYAEGQVSVLKGVEDGINIRLQITALDETEVVAGVTTRVVEERAWEDGQLHEVARNFFAQAPDGTVCYFGEDVNFYEDGQVISHEGAWRAGVGGNRPGIIMPANPTVGMSYVQEVAPGISQDRAKIISKGKTATVPAGTFKNTLLTRETSPLDPGVVGFKRYAPGVGMIEDAPLKLVRIIQR